MFSRQTNVSVFQREFFSIGPHIAVRSVQTLPYVTALPNRFAICQPRKQCLGFADVALSGESIRVVFDESAKQQPAVAAEAARLIARILSKITPLVIRFVGVELRMTEDLLTAGFRNERGSVLFDCRLTKACFKSRSVAELYSDPFRVVWNFEPLDIEVVGPLLLEDRTASTTVLDAGCGFGQNAVRLEEHSFDVSGFDISARALRICRRWVGACQQYHEADATRLPFPDGHFNHILDIGCLHFLPADRAAAAMCEYARVLKPAGRMFLRCFTPRPADWIASQEFEIADLGISPERLRSLLDPYFDVELRESLDVLYVRATRHVRNASSSS